MKFNHLTKEIIDFLETKNEGIYNIRDSWSGLMTRWPKSYQRFWNSIYWRLIYDTQWEQWQLEQYKHILSLADSSKKDICIITGYPTLTLMAYMYFSDPTMEVIFKPHSDISSQLIQWNTWGINIIQEDFREYQLRDYDTVINTILPDIDFISNNELWEFELNEESFDLDTKAFDMVQSGQEYIWSWAFGGSRQTFTLLFDYPHPKWHNIDYLLSRWSKYFDIKEHTFKKISPNPKAHIGNRGKATVKHNVTDTLFVRGIKK